MKKIVMNDNCEVEGRDASTRESIGRGLSDYFKSNSSVNKRAIVTLLSEQHPSIPQRKLEKAVETMFREISLALVCGDRVELRGFASMYVRKRMSGKARNPKTNQVIHVQDKGSVSFRASRDFIREMNGINDNAPVNDNSPDSD